MSELARFNSYDPQCWDWLRLQGGISTPPAECSKCGWFHEPSIACGALCWCGDIHAVNKPHARDPEVQARMDKRLAREKQGAKKKRS